MTRDEAIQYVSFQMDDAHTRRKRSQRMSIPMTVWLAFVKASRRCSSRSAVIFQELG